MKRFNIYQALLFILFNFFTQTLFAWDHSIDLGYGFSHDPNNTRYNNSGFLLTSDLYPIRRTSQTFWSINGALGQWYSSAPINKNLTTAALSLALRYYPMNSYDCNPVYLLGSWGPAYLSSRKFGLNTQAYSFTFQWNLGLGMEFSEKIDANFRVSHYSNAYLGRPDQGFTVLYLVSLGYLF